MTIDAKDVTQYLKDHPEFFSQNASLLAQLVLPDPHNGQAISITERQVGALRDQVKRLENKLAELIRFGEENDVLSGKVHRLDVALSEASSVASVLNVLYTHIGGDFAVPHVAVRLWNLPGDPDMPEFAPMNLSAHEFVVSLKHTYCGEGSQSDLISWFGKEGGDVQSLALVTLKQGTETFGLLALGSEEATRFYPGMGTLYLERIGEAAAAALVRTLG